MTMTKQEQHKHKYTKAKYIRLDREQDITNPNFIRMKKPVLKLLVCDCGRETGTDLMAEMPKGKT